MTKMRTAPPTKGAERICLILQAGCVLLFTFTIIKTSWISDDAAITLRTVLNFVNGYGPTFNLEERVQAYTHPLWFLTISAVTLISQDVFASVALLMIFISTLVTAKMVFGVSRDKYVAILVGVALLLSKAFIDFSTSGLENPLSHLLIVLAVMQAAHILEARGGSTKWFLLTCTALHLTRPDLIIIIAPIALIVVFSKIASEGLKQVAVDIFVAGLPLLIWILFSLIYYGSPVPNTAHAKLGTGIFFGDKVTQGFFYLLHSIHTDPLTVFIIAAGSAAGFLGGRLAAAASLGIVLYVGYILVIGGDFMAGRFFTAPFLLALIILGVTLRIKQTLVLALPVMVLGLTNAKATIFSDLSYQDTTISDRGIADERGFYFQRYGLLTNEGRLGALSPWHPAERTLAVTCGELGFKSLRAGPGTHFIDSCALADPLLARLPSKSIERWRIGHFVRQLPTDYVESVSAGQNLLADQETRMYWELIRKATQGPLFDAGRFDAIAKLNLGFGGKPDFGRYQREAIPLSSRPAQLDWKDLQLLMAGQPRPGDVLPIPFFGLAEITLGDRLDIRSFEICVDGDELHEIGILRGGRWEPVATLGSTDLPGLVCYSVLFKATLAGVEKVRISATGGDGLCSIGSMFLNR